MMLEERVQRIDREIDRVIGLSEKGLQSMEQLFKIIQGLQARIEILERRIDLEETYQQEQRERQAQRA
ncbi:hypothetical protein [Limnoglobus roseus]|uniref:Uncharacterized protein n=1 Tax=Limnoglobus roseus TaxID=2598579 RepID=A0A5C1AI43_9BACT|nr:hypothetical protein [Limnoglobus roseus]QEL18510.1 hypothetical protein PX52LOC_05536 [Limnoglobus roseus]